MENVAESAMKRTRFQKLSQSAKGDQQILSENEGKWIKGKCSNL
jgi:hypothetical protein